MSTVQKRRVVLEPNGGVGVLTLGRRCAGPYLVRRLLKAFFTIFFMASLAFFLVRLIPGSPIAIYIFNLVQQYNIPYAEAKQQVVGDSILLEVIFVYQGLGLVLFNSIQQRDYPVMQGVFLVITSMVVFANLIADLVYARLDPRIRIAGGGD